MRSAQAATERRPERCNSEKTHLHNHTLSQKTEETRPGPHNGIGPGELEARRAPALRNGTPSPEPAWPGPTWPTQDQLRLGRLLRWYGLPSTSEHHETESGHPLQNAMPVRNDTEMMPNECRVDASLTPKRIRNEVEYHADVKLTTSHIMAQRFHTYLTQRRLAPGFGSDELRNSPRRLWLQTQS